MYAGPGPGGTSLVGFVPKKWKEKDKREKEVNSRKRWRRHSASDSRARQPLAKSPRRLWMRHVFCLVLLFCGSPLSGRHPALVHMHHFLRQGKRLKEATVKEINTEIRENTCMGKTRRNEREWQWEKGTEKALSHLFQLPFDGVSFLLGISKIYRHNDRKQAQPYNCDDPPPSLSLSPIFIQDIYSVRFSFSFNCLLMRWLLCFTLQPALYINFLDWFLFFL